MMADVKGDLKFRSPRHEEAYLLRQHESMTYKDIGAMLGCSKQNAQLMVRDALIAKKSPGRPRSNFGSNKVLSTQLKIEVIHAIILIAYKNEKTVSQEVESRLVRTLVEDGLLPAHFLDEQLGA